MKREALASESLSHRFGFSQPYLSPSWMHGQHISALNNSCAPFIALSKPWQRRLAGWRCCTLMQPFQRDRRGKSKISWKLLETDKWDEGRNGSQQVFIQGSRWSTKPYLCVFAMHKRSFCFRMQNLLQIRWRHSSQLLACHGWPCLCRWLLYPCR